MDEQAKQEWDARSCTCHPDDNPPVPCPRKFAYNECVTEERLLALRDMLDAFMGWAQTDEQVAALKRGHRAMPKPTATPKQMAERAWRENPA